MGACGELMCSWRGDRKSRTQLVGREAFRSSGETSESRLPIAAMGGRGEDWRFSLRHRSTWRLHVSRDRLDGRPLRGPYFCPREEGEQPTIAAVNVERRTVI